MGDGCAELGIDADGMNKAWGACKDAKKLVKFGGGFYCGLIEIEGKKPIYVFNEFFYEHAKQIHKAGRKHSLLHRGMGRKRSFVGGFPREIVGTNRSKGSTCRFLARQSPVGLEAAWSVDPQVKIEGGKKGSLFDALEDMD